MSFKRNEEGVKRQEIQFVLEEEPNGSISSRLVTYNRKNSILLSFEENEKMFKASIKEAIEKFCLQVKSNCDTVITIAYYEKDFRVKAVKLLVVNHVKKGEK